MLLLLAFVHRFKLTKSDLGIFDDTSFVSWILDPESVTEHNRTLSEDENKYLNGWIPGLFELEGIGDDVLSECLPQNFYKLVPPIFYQSILARRENVIDLETLRNGLECKYLPFPSAANKNTQS